MRNSWATGETRGAGARVAGVGNAGSARGAGSGVSDWTPESGSTAASRTGGATGSSWRAADTTPVYLVAISNP